MKFENRILNRRTLPRYLGAIFILLTVSRVAQFSGGGFQAWVFSLGLALAVFVSAYYTGYKGTRRVAWPILILVLAVDLAFNFTEVIRWSTTEGRWDEWVQVTEDWGFWLYRIPDGLFGATPTLASAMLGILYQRVGVTFKRSSGGGTGAQQMREKKEENPNKLKVYAYLDSLNLTSQEDWPMLKDVATHLKMTPATTSRWRKHWAEAKQLPETLPAKDDTAATTEGANE